MTPDERVIRLQSLGYSERQAQFLCLAALHGGYFLRRHFTSFIGTASGGADERFLQKAQASGHVRAFGSANRTVIYHVGTRQLYRLIGDEHNRNRRTRAPEFIKQRLMGLDFVLTNLNCTYLATEAEKLTYFDGLGIGRELLPTKLYAGAKKSQVTSRHFVDKFPVFISGTPPVVHFCFIDSGCSRATAFETHLRQYETLFAALTTFELVYIAQHGYVFASAEELFRRVVGHLPHSRAVSVDRLLTHFQDRQDFERRIYERFDQVRLDRLREDRETFGSEQYVELFEVWQRFGADGLRARFQAQKPAGLTAFEKRFTACRVTNNYDLFGDWHQVA